MLYVNGNEVTPLKFPDGTASFRFEPSCLHYTIGWQYEGDQECMMLWHLVHHIREYSDTSVCIELTMPYIPNARMDRVKNDDEVFTMKWFAEFINSLNFNRVYVLDAHSNVSLALINRVQQIDITRYIDLAVTRAGDDVLFCYPDEGAAKRYQEAFPCDHVFCIKHRRWRDGTIERLELVGADKVAGKDILIVDDICSKGGTFFYTAKALKDAGANHIFLYVTHCENTVLDGEMIKSGLIDKIYTTNSIFTKEHESIEVFDLWT